MTVDRREYAGGAVSTTTTATLASTNAGSVTVGLNANTGWPFGSNKFFVVFEPGTANEEKVLVSRASSGDSSITVASDSDRGLDGTTAVTHASGATVYPVFTATDADEANELASMWEAKGDLVSHGVSTFARLAVGSDDYVLTASSGASSGLAWGLVDTDSIAADAVTAAKIAAGAVDTAELASGAVTEAKLVAALVEKLVPAGTIAATISSSADDGWALMGTTITDAETSTPALWAVAPASWKSGTSLVLPTMANKMLEGAGTTTLGASGGSNTASLSATNLPKHTHTIDHGHGHAIEADQAQHRHTVDPPSTTVTSGGSSDDVVERVGSYTTPAGAGEVHRIPDQYLDPVSAGIQVNSSNFSHTHSVTVNIASFDSGYIDPAITMSGGVTDMTGNSGDGGAALTGASFTVTNAHLAVNFQIKAH